MGQYLPMLIKSWYLFLFDFKIHMFSFDMLHSWWRTCIRNNQVIPIIFEDPVNLIYHFGDIRYRIVGAHQWIYCWFVYHSIKGLISICHLPDIHHLIDHFIPISFSNLVHLRNDNLWYIIIGDMMVSSLIQLILQLAISATNIQYSWLFVVIQTRLDLFLQSITNYMQIFKWL